MIKLNKQDKQAAIAAALLITLAVCCRLIGYADLCKWPLGVIRSCIYIFLFVAWGISLGRRIIQVQLRRYMIGIAACMVFWFVVRTIKYNFIPDGSMPGIVRLTWYAYYISILLIPMLSLFAAVSLGKPEQYRTPLLMRLLWVPTILLALTILTNDLHQKVFSFPDEYPVWTDHHYEYAPMYWVVLAWVMGSAVLALGIILRKCRIPYSKTFLWLPLIPFLLMIVYGILYLTAWSVIPPFLGDMTAVYCVLIALLFESCIQCGLIPNNTGYDKLFTVSRLSAQITDQENKVCLSSVNAMELTEEQRKNAETHPVSVDKNTLIKSHPIRLGHVLWQEDITELTEAIEQIEDNCHNLEERNRIRQENLETQKKILTLKEKNRVNDLLHRETVRQIDLIDRMLTQYDTDTDDEKRKRLLAGAAVVGAYIKRYGNLLLVSERMETADSRDLARCFEESFINLELLGVNCLHTLPSDLALSTKDMLYVYQSFETAVEACLYDLHHVWINARESKGWILLSIDFVCDTDLSPYVPIRSLFTCEDETYRFTFKLQKGGEQT